MRIRIAADVRGTSARGGKRKPYRCRHRRPPEARRQLLPSAIYHCYRHRLPTRTWPCGPDLEAAAGAASSGAGAAPGVVRAWQGRSRERRTSRRRSPPPLAGCCSSGLYGLSYDAHITERIGDVFSLIINPVTCSIFYFEAYAILPLTLSQYDGNKWSR